MMRSFIIVAIDGTAASGKTSTAIELARIYNFLMSSTGLYYRAIALKMLDAGVTSKDDDALKLFLKETIIGTKLSANTTSMTINGEIFSDKVLRSQRVNEAVAQYSAIPIVRKFLFEYQRSQADIARSNGFSGLVMEGRDITSVIFPDADLRFFLEASAFERSQRRGNDHEYDYISKRDKIDNVRTICGDGVHRINTGQNDLPTVVATISTEINKILSGKQ
jgi:cytidylate kinase